MPEYVCDVGKNGEKNMVLRQKLLHNSKIRLNFASEIQKAI